MGDIYGMADALRQVETEVGTVMTLDGINYPCTIGARADGQELEPGGWALSSGMEAVLRRELFSDDTLPTNNDVVFINFRQHKVNTVTLSPDGALVVLALEDANKDA